MALIKCKSCGKEISDKSTKCVHCGCDTDYSITYFCSECGKEFDNIKCMNCGYSPNNKKDTTNQSANVGFNFKPALKEFVEFSENEIIMGHNVNFDINFLYDKCERYLDYYLTNDFVDTMDDFHASTDKDPYKRALYKEIKKNNKK